MIIIVAIIIIFIVIIINLPMFKSYSEFVTSPTDATQSIIISGDKYVANATSYAVSTWIYINDWNVNYGKPKIILKRTYNDNTGSYDNPSLVLDAYENDLLINFATYSDSSGGSVNTETIKINNISIQKWVNITVCFGDNTVDSYINGKLVNTFVTNTPQYLPTQTTNPEFSITPEGGFSGNISNTRYYNRFLTPQEVWDIYRKGFSSNMFGNFLNQYNASFTFYQNQNV